MISLSALILTLSMNAQDKILLKNGDEISAWIVEKSDKEIKYKIIDSDDSPLVVIKTGSVVKITYRNGQEMKTVPDLVRMNNRFGIGMGLMVGIGIESAFYKFQADYFVTPGISIEFDGLVEVEGGGGMAIGAKYYFDPYSPKKLKGYAGLMLGGVYDEFFIELPFGMSYTGTKGFDLKLGFSGLYFPSYSEIGIFPELTLGWRF